MDPPFQHFNTDLHLIIHHIPIYLKLNYFFSLKEEAFPCSIFLILLLTHKKNWRWPHTKEYFTDLSWWPLENFKAWVGDSSYSISYQDLIFPPAGLNNINFLLGYPKSKSHSFFTFSLCSYTAGPGILAHFHLQHLYDLFPPSIIPLLCHSHFGPSPKKALG